MDSLLMAATERRAALPFGETPISDTEASAAWDSLRAVGRTPLTRRILAMFVLARGAGATAADMRSVRGDDIFFVVGAGTWVNLRRRGLERSVPVSARFASVLQSLARRAQNRSLLGTRGQEGPVPMAGVRDVELEMQRLLAKTIPATLVTIERLRRAWLLEQMSSALPVGEFLRLSGERSWQTVYDLLGFCPRSAVDLGQTARLAGGVEDVALIDLATWGLD